MSFDFLIDYLSRVRNQILRDIRRIVIKVGTGVLTDHRIRPDRHRVEPLVSQIVQLQRAGLEVTLVSSGAVGAGMGALGITKRPRALSELQACAAVGQLHLMTIYQHLFDRHGMTTAQILVTHDDLAHKERHLNARNTLVRLLDQQVVPIVNENDSVSFTEIKFGDNDKLSALVACLIPVDLLVLLTTVEGLIQDFGEKKARLISNVTEIDDSIVRMARGPGSSAAVGGMLSKIQAAKIVVRAGIPMVIASGLKPDTLGRILSGEAEGTLFVPLATRLKGRKRWIAFFHHPKGAIYVDEGAKIALKEQGKSLLFPGILRTEGLFESKEIVSLRDVNGTEFARGVSAISSTQIQIGLASRKAVVHRDNLVIF